MVVDANEQIEKFKEFFDVTYFKEIHGIVSKGRKALIVDFSELVKFDPDLAEQLLNYPEDTLRAAEISLEQFEAIGMVIRVRFRNLSESSIVKIKDIRSEHLGKFIGIEGLVRQASDVRPQVVSAKFECPSCGNNISILQVESKFKEPTRCSCGRRGFFRLISKSLVDAQRVVIEENPERLDGGEQPKRLSIFLKGDLVEPIMEKKTTPGSLIRIVGVLQEVPVFLKTGAQSIRYDLMVEANFIEPLEETFEELELSEEDEKKILELAKDKDVYEKLKRSIAPTIYGHDDIKEALVLMLVGGVKKIRADNTMVKGDIHVLLVGDPGSAKSMLLTFISKASPKARYVAGRGATGAGLCVSPKSMISTNPGGMETIENIVENRLKNSNEYVPGVWKQENINDIKIQSMSNDFKLHSKNPEAIWKLRAPKKVFEILLSSGKKIELTGNTQLLLIKNGKLSWKKSKYLKFGDYVATPRRLFGGNIEKQNIVDLIDSNPVVHDVKPFVMKVVKKLHKKCGTIRNAASKLKRNENNLYCNWVNEKARGNIKLKNLIKICSEVGVDYRNKIKRVSLYNGKNHNIPRYLTKDLLYLAGLIAGDGDIRYTGATYSVRLSNSNTGILKIFEETLKKRFNLNCDIQKGNSSRPSAIRTHSKILGEILLKLGLSISPKSNKLKLSNLLLHLNNSLLAEFIAGLYDTDGSVCIRKVKGSDCIDLTTCSEELARGLQLVLLRYEIHSKLRVRPPSLGKIKGNYKRWVLEIRGLDQIRKFVKNIPLKHINKIRKLKILTNKKIKPNTNLDVIPGIGEKIKSILQKNSVPLRKVNWAANLSRQKAQYIVENTGLNDFSDIKKLIYSDILWEKIVDINQKDSEFDYVYDLTVKDSHNFVVDGVLVHNTATVVKDEFLRGWALEAGALVLANKGFVCLDEMDKITPDDIAYLHEAMAQQQISINKANVQATLRAETTVLAAANPKLGRFDPYQPIASQINMPAAIINRFDLIFAIKDIPSKEGDEKIAQHVLSLQINPKIGEPEVPITLLKKYISYVRKKIFPKLDKGCMDEIIKFYVNLRNMETFGEEQAIRPIPISARQLESLIRLAEASARIRLSEKADRSDGRRAIRVLKHCLTQVGIDPKTGEIDIDRIATGISATQRNKILIIREIINFLERNLGKKSIPIEDIILEAGKKEISESEVDEVINKLKREGEIFEPRHGWVQRI